MKERMPVPKFVSCDYGSGQERLLKYVVNPSSENKKKMKKKVKNKKNKKLKKKKKIEIMKLKI